MVLRKWKNIRVDFNIFRVSGTKIALIILYGKYYAVTLVLKDLELNGGYTKLCDISAAVDLEIRVATLFSPRCPKGISESSLIGACKRWIAFFGMLIN